jgi:hypothetical protein
MPGSGGSVGPWHQPVTLDAEPGWLSSPPGQPMVSHDILLLRLVHHLPDLRLAQRQMLVSATTWSRRQE